MRKRHPFSRNACNSSGVWADALRRIHQQREIFSHADMQGFIARKTLSAKPSIIG